MKSYIMYESLKKYKNNTTEFPSGLKVHAKNFTQCHA